jgi:hypothetical protein
MAILDSSHSPPTPDGSEHFLCALPARDVSDTESSSRNSPCKISGSDTRQTDSGSFSVEPRSGRGVEVSGSWADGLVMPSVALVGAAILLAAPLHHGVPPGHSAQALGPQPAIPHLARQSKELSIAAKLGHTSHGAFLAQVRARGYTAYAIRPSGLDVLYTDERLPNADPPLSTIPRSRTNLVTSGTFTAGDYIQAVGPIMREGQLDTEGGWKGLYRGGVAVYDDGTFALGRTEGSSFVAIQERFFRPGRTVSSFMGGGAILIEKGEAVSSFDLALRQHFTQGGFGIDAAQMRRTHHLVLGVRDGYCFVVIAHQKTGREIQRDLLDLGFEGAIKFDGGSGLFVNDRPGGSPQYRGGNSTGFIMRKWGVV